MVCFLIDPAFEYENSTWKNRHKMKLPILVVLMLFSCAASFGQFIPYQRTTTQFPIPSGGYGLSVLGVSNGVLYGSHLCTSDPSAGCDPQCPKPSTGEVFCFYSTSSFTQEAWTYLGMTPGQSATDLPIEAVFGSGTCSSEKYIYTSEHRILSASTGDWTNFVDVEPSVPSGTTGRVGSFAIGTHNSGTRLFYGSYNDHTNLCPQALIWHSDDCGASWSAPFEFTVSNPGNDSECLPPSQGMPAPTTPANYSQYFHGREVHAIEVDPTNTSNIYVTIDSEGADGQPMGLWRSVDGGDTFSQLTPQSPPYVGIDFAFPAGSDKLFLETDGPGGATAGGPLLSQDKVSGDAFQVAALWPSPASPPGSGLWTGAGYGIKVTSDQNIFLATTDFDPPVSNRDGVWYFEPPNYDTALLLEDLSPPISSLTASNGTVTVTTVAVHDIQPTDWITITGANPTSFNTAGPIPVQVITPTQFTYVCADCTGVGAGGNARKNTYWGFRTVEVTDNDHTTYLYNGGFRITKPLLKMEPILSFMLEPE